MNETTESIHLRYATGYLSLGEVRRTVVHWSRLAECVSGKWGRAISVNKQKTPMGQNNNNKKTHLTITVKAELKSKSSQHKYAQCKHWDT